jgi:hypothetical protein
MFILAFLKSHESAGLLIDPSQRDLLIIRKHILDEVPFLEDNKELYCGAVSPLHTAGIV